MKNKKFDCVKMKNDIQQKLIPSFKNLTAKENNKKSEELILKDPILRKVFNKFMNPFLLKNVWAH